MTMEEQARGNAHHAWSPPSHPSPGPKVDERPYGPVTGPAERVRCQLRGSIGHWGDRTSDGQLADL